MQAEIQRALEVGATFLATKAARSTSHDEHCGGLCNMRKAGVRKQRCAVCCSKRPEPKMRIVFCTVSIQKSFQDLRLPHLPRSSRKRQKMATMQHEKS